MLESGALPSNLEHVFRMIFLMRVSLMIPWAKTILGSMEISSRLVGGNVARESRQRSFDKATTLCNVQVKWASKF